MKIICKWIFHKNDGTGTWGAKQKDCSNMTADECLNMITTLLAQNETIRLIFERE